MRAWKRGSRFIGPWLVAVLIAACAPGRSPEVAVAAPRLVPGPTGVRWSDAALSGAPGNPAPLEAWRAATRDTGILGLAVRTTLADSLVARGDTLGADSLLANPRLARSLWGLDALIRRASYRAARGDTAGAVRILEARDSRHWRAAEIATWEARLALYRWAIRDTAGADSLARSAVGRSSANAAAGLEGLVTFERIAAVKRRTLTAAEQRMAAGAEWSNGKRTEAIERHRRLTLSETGTERWRDAYAVARLTREARKPRTALLACDVATRWSTTAEQRETIDLERARAYRDAGRSDSALRVYARLVARSADTQRRMLAAWEAAREAQDRSRWREAARWFDKADSLRMQLRDGQTDRAQDARGLAGLMWWMLGDHARAESRWRSWGDPRSRFWLGVSLRSRGLAEGDSILRVEFAEKPGFDLYRVAARETLGVRGWNGRVLPFAPDTTAPVFADAVVRLAGPLALPDAAARIVSARDRRDPRAPGDAARGVAASTWRAIAAASYTGGDLAGATRAADRALMSMGSDSLTWDFVPWAFPPAFEPEVTRAANEFGIERALLWAFTRQESRFDPRAVSRSNARGLTQLLSGTARDMARALREPYPADTVVFEPARALRYGARYMRWLLDKFDGHVAIALTGYNAGAGRVRSDWRELLAQGGDMLYVEMGANADTQDYIRRILGYRQAYRELRPSGGP